MQSIESIVNGAIPQSQLELETTQGDELVLDFGVRTEGGDGGGGDQRTNLREALLTLTDYYEDYARYLVDPKSLGKKSRLFQRLLDVDFSKRDERLEEFGIQLSERELFARRAAELIDEERAYIERNYNFPALDTLAKTFQRNTEANQEYFWTFQRQLGDQSIPSLVAQAQQQQTDIATFSADDTASSAESPLAIGRSAQRLASGEEVLVTSAEFSEPSPVVRTLRREPLLKEGSLVVERQSAQRDVLVDEEQQARIARLAGAPQFLVAPGTNLVSLIEDRSLYTTEDRLAAIEFQVRRFRSFALNLQAYDRLQNELSIQIASATNAHTGTWRLYLLDRQTLRRTRVRDRRSFVRLLELHVYVRDVREFYQRVAGNRVALQLNPLRTHGFVSGEYRYLRYTLPDSSTDERALAELNWRVCQYVNFLRRNAQRVSTLVVPYVLDPALLFRLEAEAVIAHGLNVAIQLQTLENTTNNLQRDEQTRDELREAQQRVQQEIAEAEAEFQRLGTDALNFQLERLRARAQLIVTALTRIDDNISRQEARLQQFRAALREDQVPNRANNPLGLQTIAQFDFQDLRQQATLRLAVNMSNALAGVNPNVNVDDENWLLPTRIRQYTSWRQVGEELDKTLFFDPREPDGAPSRTPSNPFHRAFLAVYLEYNVKYVDESQRSLDFVHHESGQSLNATFSLAKRARAYNEQLVRKGEAPRNILQLKQQLCELYTQQWAQQTQDETLEQKIDELRAQLGRQVDMARVLRDSAMSKYVPSKVESLLPRAAVASGLPAQTMTLSGVQQSSDEGVYLVQQWRAPNERAGRKLGSYETRAAHHLDVFDRTVGNVRDYRAKEHAATGSGVLSPTAGSHPNTVVVHATASLSESLLLPTYTDRRRLANRGNARYDGVAVEWYFLPSHTVGTLYRNVQRVEESDVGVDSIRYADGTVLRPLWSGEDALLEAVHERHESGLTVRTLTAFNDGVYVAVERTDDETFEREKWFQLYDTLSVDAVRNVEDRRVDRTRTLRAYRPHRIVALFELSVKPVVEQVCLNYGDELVLDVRPYVQFNDDDTQLVVRRVQWFKRRSALDDRYQPLKNGDLLQPRRLSELQYSEALLNRFGYTYLANADDQDAGEYVCRIDAEIEQTATNRKQPRSITADVVFDVLVGSEDDDETSTQRLLQTTEPPLLDQLLDYPLHNVSVYNAETMLRDFYTTQSKAERERLHASLERVYDEYSRHSGGVIDSTTTLLDLRRRAPSVSKYLSMAKRVPLRRFFDSILQAEDNDPSTISALVSAVQSNLRSLRTVLQRSDVAPGVDVDRLTWMEWTHTVQPRLLAAFRAHDDERDLIQHLLTLRTYKYVDKLSSLAHTVDNGVWIGLRHSSRHSAARLYDSLSSLESDVLARENLAVARAAAEKRTLVYAQRGFLYTRSQHSTMPTPYIFLHDDRYVRPQRGRRWLHQEHDDRQETLELDRAIQASLPKDVALSAASEPFVFDILQLEHRFNRTMGGVVQFPWQNFLDYLEKSKVEGGELVVLAMPELLRLQSGAFEEARQQQRPVRLHQLRSVVRRFMDGEWADAEQFLPSTLEESRVLDDLKLIVFDAYQRRMEGVAQRLIRPPTALRQRAGVSPLTLLKQSNAPGDGTNAAVDARWQQNLPRFKVWYFDVDRLREAPPATHVDAVQREQKLALAQAAKALAFIYHQQQNYVTRRAGTLEDDLLEQNKTLRQQEQVLRQIRDIDDVQQQHDAQQDFNGVIAQALSSVADLAATVRRATGAVRDFFNAEQLEIDDVARDEDLLLATLSIGEDTLEQNLRTINADDRRFDEQVADFRALVTTPSRLAAYTQTQHQRRRTELQTLVDRKRALFERLPDLDDLQLQVLEWQKQMQRELDDARQFVTRRRELAQNIEARVDEQVQRVVPSLQSLLSAYLVDSLLRDYPGVESVGAVSARALLDLTRDDGSDLRTQYRQVLSFVLGQPNVETQALRAFVAANPSPLYEATELDALFGRRQNFLARRDRSRAASDRSTLQESLDVAVAADTRERNGELVRALVRARVLDDIAREQKAIESLDREELAAFEQSLERRVQQTSRSLREQMAKVERETLVPLVTVLNARAEFPLPEIAASGAAEQERQRVLRVARDARQRIEAQLSDIQANQTALDAESEETKQSPLFSRARQAYIAAVETANEALQRVDAIDVEEAARGLSADGWQRVAEREQLRSVRDAQDVRDKPYLPLIVLAWHSAQTMQNGSKERELNRDQLESLVKDVARVADEADAQRRELLQSLDQTLFELVERTYPFLRQGEPTLRRLRILRDFYTSLSGDVGESDVSATMRDGDDRLENELRALIAQQQSAQAQVRSTVSTLFDEYNLLVQREFLDQSIRSLFRTLGDDETVRVSRSQLDSELFSTLRNQASELEFAVARSDDAGLYFALGAQATNQLLADALENVPVSETTPLNIFEVRAADQQDDATWLLFGDSDNREQYESLLQDLSMRTKRGPFVQSRFALLYRLYLRQSERQLRTLFEVFERTNRGERDARSSVRVPTSRNLLRTDGDFESSALLFERIKRVAWFAFPFAIEDRQQQPQLDDVDGAQTYLQFRDQVRRLSAAADEAVRTTIQKELHSIVNQAMRAYETLLNRITDEVRNRDTTLYAYGNKTPEKLVFIDDKKALDRNVLLLNQVAALDTQNRSGVRNQLPPFDTDLVPGFSALRYTNDDERAYAYIYQALDEDAQRVLTNKQALLYGALGHFYETTFADKGGEQGWIGGGSPLLRYFLLLFHCSLHNVLQEERGAALSNTQRTERTRVPLYEFRRAVRTSAGNDGAQQQQQQQRRASNARTTFLLDDVLAAVQSKRVSGTQDERWSFGAQYERLVQQLRQYVSSAQTDLRPLLNEWRSLVAGLAEVDDVESDLMTYVSGAAIEYRAPTYAFERAAADENGQLSSVQDYANLLFRYAVLFLHRIDLQVATNAQRQQQSNGAYELVRHACSAVAATAHLNAEYRRDAVEKSVQSSRTFSVLARSVPALERMFQFYLQSKGHQQLEKLSGSESLSKRAAHETNRHALYYWPSSRSSWRTQFGVETDYARFVRARQLRDDDAESAVARTLRHLVKDLGTSALLLESNADQRQAVLVVKRSAPTESWTFVNANGEQQSVPDDEQALQQMRTTLESGEWTLRVQESLPTQLSELTDNWLRVRNKVLIAQRTQVRQLLAEFEEFVSSSTTLDAESAHWRQFYEPLYREQIERLRTDARFALLDSMQRSAPQYLYDVALAQVQTSAWYVGLLLRQVRLLDEQASKIAQVRSNKTEVDKFFAQFPKLDPSMYTEERSVYLLVRQDALRYAEDEMPTLLKQEQPQFAPILDSALRYVLELDNPPLRPAGLLEQYTLNGDRIARIDQLDVPKTFEIPVVERTAVEQQVQTVRALRETSARFDTQFGTDSQFTNATLRQLPRTDSTRERTVRTLFGALDFSVQDAERLERVDAREDADRLLSRTRTLSRRAVDIAQRLFAYHTYERASFSAREEDRLLLSRFMRAYLRRTGPLVRSADNVHRQFAAIVASFDRLMRQTSLGESIDERLWFDKMLRSALFAADRFESDEEVRLGAADAQQPSTVETEQEKITASSYVQVVHNLLLFSLSRSTLAKRDLVLNPDGVRFEPRGSNFLFDLFKSFFSMLSTVAFGGGSELTNEQEEALLKRAVVLADESTFAWNERVGDRRYSQLPTFFDLAARTMDVAGALDLIVEGLTPLKRAVLSASTPSRSDTVRYLQAVYASQADNIRPKTQGGAGQTERLSALGADILENRVAPNDPRTADLLRSFLLRLDDKYIRRAAPVLDSLVLSLDERSLSQAPLGTDPLAIDTRRWLRLITVQRDSNINAVAQRVLNDNQSATDVVRNNIPLVASLHFVAAQRYNMANRKLLQTFFQTHDLPLFVRRYVPQFELLQNVVESYRTQILEKQSSIASSFSFTDFMDFKRQECEQRKRQQKENK